jgi:ethanolamine utilization microcompartment shell protein EutL
MNKWLVSLVVCIAASVLPHAVKAAELEKIVVADTAEKFVVLAQAIRQEMAPGGRFEYIAGRSRSEVDKGLDAMAAMMEKAGSVSAMREKDKIQLFNTQEKVNGLLAKNAKDRLICTYVSPVGSHLPVKQCETLGQREANRKNATRNMEEWNKQGRIKQ